MRRGIGVLALGVLVALPVAASAGGLDFRAGGFFPRAQSNLFTDDFELYTVSKKDFNGFTGGIEYNARVAHNVELGFSLDGYGRSIRTNYRDFINVDTGGEIRQRLKLDSVPLGISVRFIPTGRHVRVAPYVAIGADLIFWHYEEEGDFIDFQDPERTIISDRFISDGVTPGAHAAAGVRVALNHDFAFVAEGRYQWAKKDNMGGDFNRNQIDLSGASATVGLHIRF
jgi:hypothetical protein